MEMEKYLAPGSRNNLQQCASVVQTLRKFHPSLCSTMTVIIQQTSCSVTRDVRFNETIRRWI